MFELVKMRRAQRACNDLQQVLAAFSDSQEMTLALNDVPYPYAVTVNYAPMIRDNELFLLFHGAQKGRKYELLKKDGRCAFTMTLRTQVELKEQSWESTNFFRSLCGDGTVHFLEGEEALEALVVLMAHHGYSDEPQELAKLKEQLVAHLRGTQVFALKVEHAGLKENVQH